MLNAKALSSLLSSNSDGRLCKRWFLMTPSGTLLAHSEPCDIKDLRKQVATAASTWQTHSSSSSRTLSSRNFSSTNSISNRAMNGARTLETNNIPANGEREDGDDGSTRTIVIETDDETSLLRYIQPQLILVLQGGHPPRKKPIGNRIWSATCTSDLQLLSRGISDETGFANGRDHVDGASSVTSSAAPSLKAQKVGAVITTQRARLEAMASAIAEEFQRTGFHMPGGERSIFF